MSDATLIYFSPSNQCSSPSVKQEPRPCRHILGTSTYNSFAAGQPFPFLLHSSRQQSNQNGHNNPQGEFEAHGETDGSFGQWDGESRSETGQSRNEPQSISARNSEIEQEGKTLHGMGSDVRTGCGKLGFSAGIRDALLRVPFLHYKHGSYCKLKGRMRG